MTKLILASQSPRRRELLEMMTRDFAVEVSQADETLPAGIHPAQGVRELALRKARAVAELQPREGQDWCVIGADTLVALDRRILGKPRDAAQCREMLEALSGRRHTVYTAVALVTPARHRVFCQEAQVEFYPLTPEEIAAYAATDEPYDKAGAYGIQGRGALLVRGITGDFYTVMGLPVAQLYRELVGLGALDGPAPGQNS